VEQEVSVQIKRLKCEIIAVNRHRKEVDLLVTEAQNALRNHHDWAIENIQSDNQTIQNQLNHHIRKLNREIAKTERSKEFSNSQRTKQTEIA
jgi:TolA-binding protein